MTYLRTQWNGRRDRSLTRWTFRKRAVRESVTTPPWTASAFTLSTRREGGQPPLPIIITHGWPGSFVEMLRLIPLLTDPASHGGSPRDAFDVVVPSLPGFAFSDRPMQPGMSNFRISDLWASLMDGLATLGMAPREATGVSSVSTLLGLAYPANVIGIHLNFIPG